MNAVKKFIVAMLVVLGLGIVFFIGYFVKSNANLKHDARNNTECKTNERVFDYADKLSDSEEETLRGEIAELEDKVGMDFVVVTMDQYTDLSEYDADAVKFHTFMQVIDCTHILVKFKNLDRTSRVTSRFVQFL